MLQFGTEPNFVALSKVAENQNRQIKRPPELLRGGLFTIA
jgi:hypothetical protein